MKRNTLICTVGTSLFGNIRTPYREHLAINKEKHEELQQVLSSGNMAQLAQHFISITPQNYICGAEITSIEDSLQTKWLDLAHLHFLVSDTDEGRQIGKFLENYYTERSGELKLQTVTIHIIEQLQDQDPKKFKVYGLRNLVRQIGKLIQKHGSENIIINATGGYKAQIAIAVTLGQALEIPVLYRHERFSEIIEFPPMPISLDYQLLGQNADILAAFESGKDMTLSEIDEFDHKIRVLLDEIEIDGEIMFTLGAIGLIFLMGFRDRLNKQVKLNPVAKEEKKDPTFRDDHYPLGFKEFVIKVWQDISWIKTAHSLPYDKQKSIKGIAFYTKDEKLIGTYRDKDQFGARFEIITTAQSQDELAWIADKLNQRFGNL